MNPEEFANAVVAMLEAEKEAFMNMLADEDWDDIRDEAYEYASQAE